MAVIVKAIRQTRMQARRLRSRAKGLRANLRAGRLAAAELRRRSQELSARVGAEQAIGRLRGR